jgi:hypothetical protein
MRYPELITRAADEFWDGTIAINQLWQTNFTYLKGLGVGVGVGKQF